MSIYATNLSATHLPAMVRLSAFVKAVESRGSTVVKLWGQLDFFLFLVSSEPHWYALPENMRNIENPCDKNRC